MLKKDEILMKILTTVLSSLIQAWMKLVTTPKIETKQDGDEDEIEVILDP